MVHSHCLTVGSVGKLHRHIHLASTPAFKPNTSTKNDSGGGAASGCGRGLCTMEGGAGVNEGGSQDSSVSFNREQIIVEVNLNNQTLNVSKGSDGKGVTSSTSSLLVHRHANLPTAVEGKEQDDNEDVGEDEEDEYEQRKEEMENCSDDEDDEDEEEMISTFQKQDALAWKDGVP